MAIIYFDNAATTFPKPESVYRFTDEVQRTLPVNAGRGSYKLAREATKIIDDTRREMANLVRLMRHERMIFTSSATLALNEIILGLEWNEYKNVYITPFEHNSVMRPLHAVRKKYGINIIEIPFDKSTLELDLDGMKSLFAMKNPDYVFATHVSNVTGYILPVKQIVESAKAFNAVVTLDCSQSMGLIPINVSEIGADFYVFAGHKTLYAHFGIGGFVYNSEYKLQKVITGGTGSDSLNLDMPDNFPTVYEAASPDINSIASLNASLKWLADIGAANILNEKKKKTEYLITRLKEVPGIELYLPHNLENHIGIVSFNLKGYMAEDIGIILDADFDIAVRTGYHCAPLIHDLLNTIDKRGTVRVSLGYFNTNDQIDTLVSALKEI